MSFHDVELDDTEIKLLLVAIRQVEHTFTVAEAQSAAAGEPIAADYEGVRESYRLLHEKLSEYQDTEDTDDPPRPFIVK